MTYLRFILFFVAILLGSAFTARAAEPAHHSDLDTEVGHAFSQLKETIAGPEAGHDAPADLLKDQDQTKDPAHGEETHASEPGAEAEPGENTDHASDTSHDAAAEHAEDEHPIKKESDAGGPAETAAHAMGAHAEAIHYKEGDRTPFTGDVTRAGILQQNGEYAAAINVYLNVLNTVEVPDFEKKKAMIGLAETYYRRGSFTQAVSILDQFLQTFPKDKRRSDVLFQVGLLYREMRLFPEAITTFYRVLNAIVVTGDVDMPKYLALARRAQFEIARSHYFAEEWDQALMLLDRIELFELSSTDRESLLYYQAHATLRMGELDKGLKLVQRLIHTYPTSPLVPEMLYTKAETLTQMQQHEDAVATLMELLEQGGLPNENSSDQWNYWRQQAGNFFANRYYDNKDFLAALRLYQGIVVLDDRAEWQLPIIYQMGLCFEKLGMFDRATESLQFVVQGVEELAENKEATRDAALEQLLERAEWRLSMLNWRSGIEKNSLPMLTLNPDPSEDEE